MPSRRGAEPETKTVKLGYIALTDAAALVIAKEKGFFAKHGLPDAEVLKQASWGATRDNLVLGSEANGIDGAHILTPMPYLISTGKVTQGGVPTPMYILARLNLDAQAISVAAEYNGLKLGLDASPLKEAFAKKRAAGGDPKVAMTFPGGTHDLWIRYWLASGGIDPDKDVSTIVVPPPQMVANMKVGTMDAFCVGEPWNAQLINQKLGYTAANTYEIWNKHPEKALRSSRRLGRQAPEGGPRPAHGGDGGSGLVRQAREPRGDVQDRRHPRLVQRARRRHPAAPEGRVRLRHRRQGGEGLARAS